MKAILKKIGILRAIVQYARTVKVHYRNAKRDLLDGLVSRTFPLERMKKGVLLVRLDAIGDFIIWLDSAKELRALYPSKRVVLCANSTWAGLAEHFPYWDEVIPVEPGRLESDPAYRFKFLWRIRLRRFEVAIQPTFSRMNLQGDSLIRASCAAQRIGSTGALNNIHQQDKNKSNKWYTDLIPANPAPMMEIARNAEFIRGLGMKNFLGSVTKITRLLDLPEALRISEPYCVIFPEHVRQQGCGHLPSSLKQWRIFNSRTAIRLCYAAGRTIFQSVMRLLKGRLLPSPISRERLHWQNWLR